MKKALLLAMFTTIFSATAICAEYRVEIDCNHNSIQNTDTANRITVSLHDASGKKIFGRYRNGVRNCLVNDASFTINSSRPVVFVEIFTNGNDAFYIDEFRVYRDGVLIKHHGRDNGRGWCLSTDRTDSNGSWSKYVSGPCQPKHRFRIADSPGDDRFRSAKNTV